MDTKVTLLIFGFIILLIALSYEMIVITLTKQVPFFVSLQYNNLKSQYSCDYCFSSIEICKDINQSTVYLVGGGSQQGSGRDTYLDNNGQVICDSKWSFGECKGGCPEDFHKGCPQIKECKKIVEWEGK